MFFEIGFVFSIFVLHTKYKSSNSVHLITNLKNILYIYIIETNKKTNFKPNF